MTRKETREKKKAAGGGEKLENAIPGWPEKEEVITASGGKSQVVISNRTLLVLYLTCVRHPYLFPLLRQGCKDLHDDAELEIEYFKDKNAYGQTKFMSKRLSFHLDSIDEGTVFGYVTEFCMRAYDRAVDSSSRVNTTRVSNDRDIAAISSLIKKMRAHPRYADVFSRKEGRKLQTKNRTKSQIQQAIKWFWTNQLFDICMLLICHPKIDASFEDNTLIVIAAQDGHTDVVQLLVTDRRINPSILENVAARAAKWKGYSEIVNFFLEDPRLDADGRAQLRKDLPRTALGVGVWCGAVRSNAAAHSSSRTYR